jgi:hypothetical protein
VTWNRCAAQASNCFRKPHVVPRGLPPPARHWSQRRARHTDKDRRTSVPLSIWKTKFCRETSPNGNADDCVTCLKIAFSRTASSTSDEDEDDSVSELDDEPESDESESELESDEELASSSAACSGGSGAGACGWVPVESRTEL